MIFSGDLAISSVLDLSGKRGTKGEGGSEGNGEQQDEGMSEYRTGSAGGARGSAEFWVWPLASAARVSSSIFIDPLELMSLATGRIKLQRSHTSQGEREREKGWGGGWSEAGWVSAGDERECRFPDGKSKAEQTPKKGQSLQACSEARGVYYDLKVAMHKTWRRDMRAKIKTRTPRREQTEPHDGRTYARTHRAC